MKRKYILILGVLAMIMAFTGCSNSSKETDSTNSKGNGKTEIEFWYGLGSEAGKEMQSIIDSFNSSQDEVFVKGIQQADYSTTWKKIQAAIAAKNQPAVFLIGSNVIQNYGGKDGILLDLEELVNNKDFKYDDFLEVFTKNNEINKKVYAIPAYGTTQIIYYNKEVFKNAGIDPLQSYNSWENIAEAAKQIVEKTDVEKGHMIMWNSENLRDMAFSNGGKYLSDDGKTVTINSPEWVETWEYAREQIFDTKNMGVLSGGQGWEYWYKTIDMVNNGTAGSYTGSSGDRGNLDFNKIDAIEQPGFNGKESKPVASSLNMAIPKDTSEEEVEAAFKWISYFTSDEVQAKWSMKIGYVPIRKTIDQNPEYKKFVEENPYANVAFNQSQHSSPEFIDPTNGKITDALEKAADKVELQNVPAKTALDEAQKEAQEALDNIK